MSNRETELGTLIIVVLKARNLNDKHSLYKQDVFAQVTFNGTTKKTKVAIRGGQHPEWDEEIRYPVMKQSGDKFRKLEVACYAKESRSDDILGKGELDITDTLKIGEFDDWVPLNVDGVVRGDLYLEMTFYSNGPAPPSDATPWSDSPKRSSSKPERISRPPQVGPQPGALQETRHPSRSLTPEPHHPVNQSRPVQITSIPPVSDRFATAALHNLLSDPMTSQQPLSNAYYSPKGYHSRSPSASSPKPADSPLPTLQREVTPPLGLPSTLLPGGGRPHPRPTPSHPLTAPQFPSTLKTGGGRVVSSPNPSQHITAQLQQSSMGSVPHNNDAYVPRHPPNHTLPIGNTHFVPIATNTYSSPSFSANPTISQPAYGVPVTTASPPQHQEATPTESFSFPIPMLHTSAPREPNGPDDYAPPLVQASYTYTPPITDYPAPPSQADYLLPPPKSGYPQSSYTSPPQPTYHYWQQPSLKDKLSDPFRQARYSTPLPLPSGSESPSRDRQSVSPSTTNSDQARVEVLRHVESEAEQRKTQEEKDRELALALDKELNL
ncbi:hypothetical protein E4T56_gene9605 [Termitomyces sp. T112]|nr:hypothetical protein E4T56_gene9605 [Termitomyces sp. T112]